MASARAQRLCIQNVTHELVLSWEILNGQRPAGVHAELAYPDGHLEQIGLKPIRGTQSFPINYPKGGTVTARVIARDSTDSPAIGEASLRLEACGKLTRILSPRQPGDKRQPIRDASDSNLRHRAHLRPFCRALSICDGNGLHGSTPSQLNAAPIPSRTIWVR
jgi:hypothetical protein